MFKSHQVVNPLVKAKITRPSRNSGSRRCRWTMMWWQFRRPPKWANWARWRRKSRHWRLSTTLN